MFQVNATLVANAFIDEYMAGASGEYVKVYLYLLRHWTAKPDAAQVAEALHYTEGDVKRAIAYWEKAGVLVSAEAAVLAQTAAAQTVPVQTAAADPEALQTSAGTGESAVRTPVSSAAPSPASARGLSGRAAGGGGLDSKPSAPVHSRDQVSRLADDEDFAQLLYIAQKYMNKVFTQRECQVFAYLYGELKLSAELLEYLVAYCVQNGHTSIRYIETVAINWHQKGMVTLEAAKAYSAGFNKDAFAVMKAFGLNDRRPGEAEMRFIETWFGVYGFTREVVLEACNRTIEATHAPSFKYADKILSEWRKAGVKNLSDVEDLDMIRRRQEAEWAAAGKAGASGTEGGNQSDKGSAGKGSPGGAKTRKSGAANRFHNFEQSTTDYDSLMMERVRARMKE